MKKAIVTINWTLPTEEQLAGMRWVEISIRKTHADGTLELLPQVQQVPTATSHSWDALTKEKYEVVVFKRGLNNEEGPQAAITIDVGDLDAGDPPKPIVLTPIEGLIWSMVVREV